MAAANAAYTTFTSYNRAEHSADQEATWASWQARINRYAVAESLDANTAYDDINRFAKKLLTDHKLYPFTRGIYNPVARLITTLQAYTFAGDLDMQTLRGGALPLVFDNEAMETPLRLLMQWSNLNESKAQWVRQMALLGDGFIKLVDTPNTGRVRLELLHPAKVREARFDPAGNVRAIVIEYDRIDDEPLTAKRATTTANRAYRYTEIIQKMDDGSVWVETFREGEPHPFAMDDQGQPVARYELPYDFVPVTKGGLYLPTTGRWALNAFGRSTRKIHEINDAASLLNDNIRKIIYPLFAVFGGGGAKLEIASSADSRESVPYIGLAKDARIEPMVANLAIGEARENILQMLDELVRDVPVLALATIREHGGDMTAPGISAAYSDAIAAVQHTRAACGAPLLRALQMGVTIGAVRGYTGFEGFDLGSYDAGRMNVSIKARPVISDELTLKEQIDTLARLRDLPPAIARQIMTLMNIGEADISAILRGLQVTPAANATGAQPALTSDGLAAFDALLQRTGLNNDGG